MVSEFYEISKEDYDKAMENGAESIISDAIKWGYGVSRAKVTEIEGKYYLSYNRGNSCD